METNNLDSCRTIVIGSGKGGVGKSTVSVNLAVALANAGLSVGLLDADIYGPSIPVMMGLRRLKPKIRRMPGGRDLIDPFMKFGIKTLSVGFFMEEARSAVWRGALLHGTLQKMLFETLWSNLDVLLIDLPPGTGDVQISLAQLLKIQGALLVCTPQEVAALDAVKAINAFHMLDIPLLGIIENMSGFTVPGTTQTYHIFGEGKGQELACRFNTSLLATIPLIQEIRQAGDNGSPVALHQGADQAGLIFHKLADTIIKEYIQEVSNPFA